MLKSLFMHPGDKIKVRATVRDATGILMGTDRTPQYVVLALEPGKNDPMRHKTIRAMPGEELTIVHGPEKIGLCTYGGVRYRDLTQTFFVEWDFLRTNCDHVK